MSVANITWDVLAELEGLHDSPKDFAEVFQDVSPDKYHQLFSAGFTTTRKMTQELRRQLTEANSNRPAAKKRPVRIGQNHAAQNDN